MKKSLITAVLCGLILTALTGCAEQNAPADPAPSSTVTADVPSATKSSDDITAKPADPTEMASDEETAPETQIPTEKEENQPEESSPPDVQTEIPKPSETQPEQTNPPKENEPAPTEPVQPPKTGNPKPTEPEKPSQPIPTEPPATETPKPTEPKPEYTQADYDRIIRETTAYAESYAKKGFTFEWKDSMEFGWDVGYMGTPRIETEGVDGTISRLKTHIDKIVETGTNPAYGIPSDSVTYKVVQITIDGDIAFAVIYGG